MYIHYSGHLHLPYSAYNEHYEVSKAGRKEHTIYIYMYTVKRKGCFESLWLPQLPLVCIVNTVWSPMPALDLIWISRTLVNVMGQHTLLMKLSNHVEKGMKLRYR